MTLYEKVLAGGVVVAIIFGLYGLVYPKAQTYVDTGKVDVAAIVSAVYDKVKGEVSLGAASSPALNNDGCMDLNGVTKCYYSSAWAVASTSCMFKLPGATTTLQFATAQVGNARGTANVGEWGWSYGVMATTSSFGVYAISATVQTVIVASSTGSVGVNPNTVLPPNAYLVFKQGSTTPTGVTGRCSAEVATI